MFGLFKFKKDPRDLSLIEFDKIIKLNEKIDKLDVSDDVHIEIRDTQRDVLLNNFHTIAHTFQIKNEVAVTQRDGLLNLQSTEKRVIDYDEKILHNFNPATIEKYNVEVIEVDHIANEVPLVLDVSLERKFLLLKKRKINKKVYESIIKKVQNKVKKVCIALSEECPYNEAVFYEFIINNFEEEEFNLDNIEDRFNYVSHLMERFRWCESFDIAAKNVLIFNHDEKSMNKTDLVKNLKTNRFDFILQVQDGIVPPKPRFSKV